MSALLSRLLLWQKFFILALLGAILVSLPIALFLNESNKTVDVAKLEVQGLAPTRVLLHLVQLIQEHRGLSTMLLRGDEQLKDQVVSKQQEADQAFAAMDSVVNHIESKVISTAWQQARGEWVTLAGRMARQLIFEKDSFTEHTLLIARLVRLNDLLIDHFGLRLDPNLDSYSIIDAVMVQSPILAETLGRMRGRGAGLLVQKNATQEDRMAIGAMADKAKDLYETIGYALAKAMSANQALQSKFSDPVQASFAAGNKAIHLAQEQIMNKAQLGFSSWDYYLEFTEAIGRQLKLNDMALDELEHILNARMSMLTTTKYTLLTVMLLVSGIIALVGFMIVRSVTHPLGVALDAARVFTEDNAEKLAVVEAIANGNLELDVAVTRVPKIDPNVISGDEVGVLLKSVVGMSEVQLSLDQAFRKMTASLRQSRAAEETRDWLKTGQNELNALIRDERETAEFADKVLCYLIERLGAGVGALYLYDERAGDLRLAATYAMTRRKNLGQRYGLGQGLIGQAARERKTICLTKVPPDYLPIGSALGTAVPRNVTAIPLLHADTLVGALEIGSFKVFSDTEFEFLERAMEGIAIGFNVSLARYRTQELLEQAKQQAEELRVQQEELQQTNEELEERAEMLERQREQIRMKNDQLEAASREIQHKANGLRRVNA